MLNDIQNGGFQDQVAAVVVVVVEIRSIVSSRYFKMELRYYDKPWYWLPGLLDQSPSCFLDPWTSRT